MAINWFYIERDDARGGFYYPGNAQLFYSDAFLNDVGVRYIGSDIYRAAQDGFDVVNSRRPSPLSFTLEAVALYLSELLGFDPTITTTQKADDLSRLLGWLPGTPAINQPDPSIQGLLTMYGENVVVDDDDTWIRIEGLAAADDAGEDVPDLADDVGQNQPIYPDSLHDGSLTFEHDLAFDLGFQQLGNYFVQREQQRAVDQQAMSAAITLAINNPIQLPDGSRWFPVPRPTNPGDSMPYPSSPPNAVAEVVVTKPRLPRDPYSPTAPATYDAGSFDQIAIPTNIIGELGDYVEVLAHLTVFKRIGLRGRFGRGLSGRGRFDSKGLLTPTSEPDHVDLDHSRAS